MSKYNKPYAEVFSLSSVLEGGSLLPFSDDFARADGDVANGWLYSAGVWTISSGAVVATPTYSANVLTNSDMETGDPPSGYNAKFSAVLSSAADERTGGTGSASLNAARGTTNTTVSRAIEVATIPKGQFFRWSLWMRNVDAATGVTAGLYNNLDQIAFAYYASTDWASRTAYGHNSLGQMTMNFYISGSQGQSARFDDCEFGLATISDCYAVRNLGSSDVSASVSVTLGDYSEAGIVACVDNSETPTSYLLGTIYKRTGTSGYYLLEKCVSGTFTALAQGTVTYSAGATLELVKSGTTVQLYYNDIQVGTDQTVSDAAITDNVIHGMFSASADNSLDNFACTTAPT